MAPKANPPAAPDPSPEAGSSPVPPGYYVDIDTTDACLDGPLPRYKPDGKTLFDRESRPKP